MVASSIRSLFRDDSSDGAGPVHATSLSDAIDQRLISAIVRGEYPPGAKLSEVELATALGVSRTPLRETLGRLSADGLIVREPNRGMRVAPLSAEQAIQFYDCRILLEGRTIELSAPHIAPVHVDALNRVLDSMRNLEQGDDTEDSRWTWLGIVEEFHDIYRGLCPNRELIRIVHSTASRALRLRVLNIERPGRMAYSLAQHTRVATGLAQRDPDASAKALNDLLETSKIGILASLADTHQPTYR